MLCSCRGNDQTLLSKEGWSIPATCFKCHSILHFCTLGCKCLGPNCMGPPKKSTQSKTRYPPVPPVTLPRLQGNSTLTTLTTPQKTPSTNLHLKRSQSLIDLLRCTTTQAVLPVSQRSSPQPRRKSSLKLSQKIFSICSTSAYDAEVLQQLLRSCGRRKSSHKVTARSSAPLAGSTSEPSEAQVKIRGSYLRKLSVSEVACIRKKKNFSSESNILHPTLNRELVSSSSSNSDEFFSEIPLFQLSPQITPWPTLYPLAGSFHAGETSTSSNPPASALVRIGVLQPAASMPFFGGESPPLVHPGPNFDGASQPSYAGSGFGCFCSGSKPAEAGFKTFDQRKLQLLVRAGVETNPGPSSDEEVLEDVQLESSLKPASNILPPLPLPWHKPATTDGTEGDRSRPVKRGYGGRGRGQSRGNSACERSGQDFVNFV
jgi:hypothetical protein